MPAISFAIGTHLILILISLSDTWFGLVIILTVYAYPYMLRTLTLGYRAIGPNYRDCARNLGESPLKIVIKVELPMLLRSIYAGAVVVFLIAFSEYFLVFLIGGGLVPAVTSYLLPFLQSSDFPIASLLTLIFTFIPLMFFLLTELVLRRVSSEREAQYT